MKKNLIAVCSFLLLVFVIVARPAGAYLQENQYTETEKIGFAFYQLANIDPDFVKWIKNSAAFSKALPTDKVYMLNEDKYRLESGFFDFNPDDDLIHLESKAQIRKFMENGQPKKNLFELFFTDDYVLYLPVKVGDVWIAVIPQDVEKFSVLEVGDDDYAKLTRRLLYHSNYNPKQDIMIHFTLRARAVDTSAPMEAKGFELWPLLTDIAAIEIWDERNKEFLWARYAPWYVPPDQKEILDLFGD